MTPEALILRRCYPVPVTSADLRAAYLAMPENEIAVSIHHAEHLACNGMWGATDVADVMEARYNMRDLANRTRRMCMSALKAITSAIDEVYAVVDGREVRVAVVLETPLGGVNGHGEYSAGGPDWRSSKTDIRNLLEVADEQGYWERPHEVRLDLSPRPVTHDEVARAVVVGQQYLERRARG